MPRKIKTATFSMGQVGGSPKGARGSLKLKPKSDQGPSFKGKAFIRGFAKLVRAHNVGKNFDVALMMRPKRDREPSLMRPRFMVSHKDRVPGGKADSRKPSDFCPRQLEMGIKVEREHTKSNALAMEIAMDHLSEDPRYYSKLKKIHKEDATFFEDLMEEWDWLREGKKRRANKKLKDMEEYGSQGAVIAKGGISDPGHFPPTLGFPSS